MSGLDKILEHINNDATESANRLIEDAKQKANNILSLDSEEAKRLESNINKQLEHDVAAAKKRIQSTAELKEKRMILEAKQREIDDVLKGTIQYLESLDDKAYFEIILAMLNRYATNQQGIIKFSAKDLGRLSKEVENEAHKLNLEISKDTVNINGGFILVYGDIEENCSFDALISASHEELQDKIGQILFS